MSTDKNSIFYSNSFMDYIGEFLDKDGGIVVSSIEKLVELMKESHDKLVPKCMAMTIISLSSTDVQMKLCNSGVWNILFQWLQDGLKNDTTCFILEILRLYRALPISFDILTSNSCPKLIKKLSKNGNPDIISIARTIVSKWKKVVEERTLKDAAEIPVKKLKLDDNITIVKSQVEKVKIRTVKVRNTDLRTAGVEDPEIESLRAVKKLIKKAEEKPGMEEIHLKVNANVDKRKVLEIHESKNFINSIMQTPAPPRKKKKRSDISINKSASDISIVEESNTDVKESALPDASVVTEKTKKRVSWAPTDSIQNIKYFELDENERVNVNKVSIEEMKKKERMIERQHASHKFTTEEIDDDSQSEKWYKPLMVLGVPPNKIEVTSVEKTVQFERERKVLKVLYFVKEGIPFSPTEPENDSYDVKEPLIIPLEDIVTPKSTVKVAVTNDGNSKLLIYTENEGSECQITLRPDVANLLKSMTQNSANIAPSHPPAEIMTNEYNNPDAPHTRSKLINIIRSRHPDIDPEKLTSAEVCKLLEPMRDQLIREGILSMPVNQNLSIPPPNFVPNQAPPWFTDPRSNFPRHPQDLQMMQQCMPRMGFLPNMPIGILPPQILPFIQPPLLQPHMRPVCRFLVSNGFCRSGNNCGFSHTLPDGPPRQYHQNRH